MAPKLQDIYTKIDEYLLMPEKQIIKLLTAFWVGNQLPTPAAWLFIASGSSAGKTDLLNLLELCPGYYALDDLTSNSLLSGMKRHDESASLLHRLPPQAFLVFSDFTVMLEKHKEELSAIIGKLRVVYDGKASRMTGGLESEIKWEGKIGLLAGCTTALYTKTEDYAAMGQRMVIYQLEQPDDYDIGHFNFDHSQDDRKLIKLTLQEMFRDYLKSLDLPKSFKELPPFDKETQREILDIAHLTVSARSPVTRQRFHRDRPVEMREAKEGIGRIQKQLMTLAYGLLLQNEDKKLTDYDRAILYKIGLDCIDPRRRAVLQTLTKYAFGGDIERISEAIMYPRETTEKFVEDLFTLGMLDKMRHNFGNGSKYTYKIKDKYATIMRKFEGIASENKELPSSETEQEDFASLSKSPVGYTEINSEIDLESLL